MIEFQLCKKSLGVLANVRMFQLTFVGCHAVFFWHRPCSKSRGTSSSEFHKKEGRQNEMSNHSADHCGDGAVLGASGFFRSEGVGDDVAR